VGLRARYGGWRVVGQFFLDACGLAALLLFLNFLLSLWGTLFNFCTMVRSPEERAHAVEVIITSGSPSAARRILRREWGRRGLPTVRTLARWVREFREGSTPGAPHRQPRPLRTPEDTLRRIRAAVSRHPHWSVRRVAARCRARPTTVWRYLRRQLGLFPFKLQLTQKRKRGDKVKRQRFCRWLLEKWDAPRFRSAILFSDEAHFYLSGQVNKQNCRVWGRENPQALVESDPHAPHITVWCGLTSRGILGPYLFQARGRTVTVTGARYRAMLEKKLVPELARQRISLSRLWFQQDGASPHTTRGVLTYLGEVFPGKVISKGGDVPWPPRSPDLSPLDFFLWGHLKAQVYATPVKSLGQLRRRLGVAIRSTLPSAIRAALDQVPTRARLCLRRRGRDLEGVLPHH